MCSQALASITPPLALTYWVIHCTSIYIKSTPIGVYSVIIIHSDRVKCVAKGKKLLKIWPEKVRPTANFLPPAGLKLTTSGLPDYGFLRQLNYHRMLRKYHQVYNNDSSIGSYIVIYIKQTFLDIFQWIHMHCTVFYFICIYYYSNWTKCVLEKSNFALCYSICVHGVYQLDWRQK